MHKNMFRCYRDYVHVNNNVKKRDFLQIARVTSIDSEEPNNGRNIILFDAYFENLLDYVSVLAIIIKNC